MAKEKKFINVLDPREDYWDKLSPDERKWLYQFNREVYGRVSKKNKRKQLFKKDEQIKQIYDERNARKRDLMNQPNRVEGEGKDHLLETTPRPSYKGGKS